MTDRIRTILITLIVTLSLFAPSMAVQAAGEPCLRLSTAKLDLAIGQMVTIDILVENAPPIYGIESHLSFDPTALQAVDTDPDLDGVQVAPGDFFNVERAFILQHQVDNQAGRIDYALTLVNPAPTAQGNGVLARISFLAQKQGRTTVRITKGLFGTRSGETVAPLAEDVEVQIVPADQRALSDEDQGSSYKDGSSGLDRADPGAAVGQESGAETQPSRTFFTVLAVEFALVIVLIALGGVRLIRGRRRSARA